MKLTKVEIKDYKSIRQTTPFEVGQITCLVGKNESGKTALLQGLYKLNPVVPEHDKFDVTDEYPRAEVEEYRQGVESKEIDPAIVVQAEYTLDPDEITAVESVFGRGVLLKPTITLSKGYDNQVSIEIETDETAAVKGLVKSYKLPAEVAAKAVGCDDLLALKAYLDGDGQERQKQHAAAKAQAETLTDPDAKTKAIHEADTLAESEVAKKLKGLLTAILVGDLSSYIWTHHLKARWPKFLYFDEYYQMEGHVNIEKLKERLSGKNLRDSDRPMLGLIDLA
jgi:predicted ATP-dependent endonuclease of OLD family